MKHWVLKKIYDEVVTGQDEFGKDIIDKTFSHWKIVSKQNQFMTPRNADTCIRGIDIPKEYAKVQLDEDGHPEIVEDTTVKNQREYKKKRAKEYPHIGDQLDMIFKTVKYLKDNGTDIGLAGSKFVADIMAIKNRHPKPGN